MSTLLLHTKLYVPLAHRTQISRPHLVTRLDDLRRPQCRFALIAAPPGFGKSTLLSEWIGHSGIDAAWLSLDEADNDPVRFWDYVIAALRTVQSGLGEQFLTLSHEPNPLPQESLLTLLINEIDQVRTPFALVLDDYHTIHSEPIHRAVSFLLGHMPPAMRLIISSRTDPPLPLARLRARNQMVELRAADLRLSREETSTLLARMTGLQLDAHDIEELNARTEGWAAGVQLASLALHGREDHASFLKTFTGDHRFILDYLADEILDRQPESVRHFLLTTSILGRLQGQLCEAVSGQAGGQSILELLERNNLFLVALDGKRQWYRYHQLFADFLRYRLQQSTPAQIPELHRRASVWFQTNGLLLEAVHHALVAEDFDRAASLIEQNTEQLIWRRPELHTVLNWLDALPPATFAQRPILCLYHAWTLYLTNRMRDAEQRVADAEQSAAAETASNAMFHGMTATIRSTLTGIRQDFVHADPLARRALQQLPPGAISWRCMAAINLGVSCAALGELDEAVESLSYAMELSQEIGSAFAMLSAFWHLASLRVNQLRLYDGEQTCWTLLQLIQAPDLQRFPVEGYIALLQGEIALERHTLEAAERHLLQSAEQINPEGFALALVRAYIALARLRYAQGNLAGRADYLHKAQQLVITHNLQGRASALDTYQAGLWIEQGQLELAGQWIEANRMGLEDDFGFHREPHYLVWARLLMARARREPASDHLVHVKRLLHRMVQRAERSGRTGSLVRALILQALAFDAHVASAHGEGAAPNLVAVTVLARALSLGQPENAIRTFADEGAPLALLIEKLVAAQRNGRLDPSLSIAPEYLATVLAATNGAPTTPAKTPAQISMQASSHTHALIEPLSQREHEVLQLLIEGLSSNSIAEQLVISVGTARKHIKNIYGKLAVHSRVEAVNRSRELGLH